MEQNESTSEDDISLRMISAAAFEGGLLFLAFALGWLFSCPPLASIPLEGEAWGENLLAVGLGIAATLPPVLGMLWLVHSRLRIFQSMQKLVDTVLIPMFRKASYWDLAAVCLAAGVGEEALFRGFLQSGLTTLVPGFGGIVLAIVVTSGVFGLAHCISPSYFVIATLMSVYLGLLYLWTGNLLAPIVMHGLYDFVTLVYLLRRERAAVR